MALLGLIIPFKVAVVEPTLEALPVVNVGEGRVKVNLMANSDTKTVGPDAGAITAETKPQPSLLVKAPV